jgi:SAM-dependent methyltransferase
LRNKFEPLRIVDESREALFSMPEGKQGTVVGSGINTEQWKAKGWKTLDIDPKHRADMIHDANTMTEILPPESQDFIYAELINMDPMGLKGASPARLLQQFNKVLKPDGKLIIKTAHIEGESDSTLPNRNKYIELLKKHGFTGVAELGPIEHYGPEGEIEAQSVIYYGEKKRAGFQKDSGEVIYPN